VSSIDLWYATRATGIVSLVLLTTTMVLGIATAGRAASSAPRYARLALHRRVSMLTVVFLAIHVLTAVVDTYVDIGWASIFLPFTSRYRPFWLGLGAVGVDLLVAVAVTSALRRHLPARAWRLVHWLAYASWPVGVAHALGMGTDAGLAWVDGLVAACFLAVLGAVAWRISDSLEVRSRVPRTVLGPRRRLRPSVSAAAGGGASAGGKGASG